jgi:type 2 lantibiotic biosynthesis protein LanM
MRSADTFANGGYHSQQQDRDLNSGDAKARPELRRLVGRAMPLYERWQGGIIVDPGGSATVATRVRQWRQALSVEGELGLLDRRLAFDDVDLASCNRWLGSVSLASEQPLPRWAERLDVLLQYSQLPRKDAELAAQSFVPPDTQLPFQDVWIPFVERATQDLRRQAGTAFECLAKNALHGFQRHLLRVLSHLAALPMAMEFKLSLAQHDPVALFVNTNESPAPRNFYRRYVGELLGGGLLSFFQQYAVLARLMATAIEHWIDFVAEFSLRVQADRIALAARFHEGRDLGAVAAVKLGLSDPHHCGRSVVTATFTSGRKFVYKPKDLAIDEVFSALVEWMNERSPVSLRLPRVLNRSTHGWVEFVEYSPCRNPGEAERYYLRVGMLLALTYILGGTDFHLENVIASGEHPVLVDLETMLQALPRPFDPTQTFCADRRAAEIMHRSVLRTGLLPSWRVLNPGKSFDLSAIGAEGPQDTGYNYPAWENINTDRMLLVRKNSIWEPASNLPTLDGKAVSAKEYAEAMATGFTNAYHLLLAARGELLHEGGPLSGFRRLKLRTVLRSTQVYGMMSQRLLHPEFLRDAADRSIELDRLASPFLAVGPNADAASLWPIFRAELSALERLDVPFFTLSSDSEMLFADGHVAVPEFLSESGFQSATSCIEQLSEDDLLAQTNFIRSSLHLRFTSPSALDTESALSIGPEERIEVPITPAELVAAAASIAQQIQRCAIKGRDGSTTWLSLLFNSSTERMTLQPMGNDLYDGTIGVAFFLAALEHVTGGAGFRDLALAALAPLRQALTQPLSPAAGWSTLGAATGLGGQLYGLARIGEWLGADEVFDLSRQIAARFVPERIARDEALDVLSGAAGGILSLLAWSTSSRDHDDATAAAQRCGEHLLEKRIRAESGHRTWRVPWARRPLTGFAHGAAGIAYALARLSQVTGETRFKDAAQEGVDYETAIYSRQARNWPDLRDVSAPDAAHFGVAWCRGATGVGLARLGALPALDTPGIREDISNGLRTTLATSTSDADHLCCGNMGRIDFLLQASLRLGRTDVLAEARRRASLIVAKAAGDRGYRLLAQAPGVMDSPALFQGIAGIGYTLLRVSQPEQLPCLLLWE